MKSRREFLTESGHFTLAALASLALPRYAPADPLSKRPGIQLYTINEAMRTEPAGSLNG